MYLTPDKLRTMGFGIDFEGLEDFELASILNRARSITDAYCTVPRRPQAHSFLGGTITGEQHSWRLPESDMDVGTRRIYPYHSPITEVTAFKVKVTNTQYVEIGPSEIFINNTEGYIEVVSLAFTGVGLFGAILPSIGLMRPVAEIGYLYGEHFEAVDEIVYATDARTYRAQNQFWHEPETAVVKVDGVEQVLTTDYTVDGVEGTVLFTTPQVGRVTFDYHYTLPREVRDAQGAIATHLISERELLGKGFGAGVANIKVETVSITRSVPRLASDGSNLAECVPAAAGLLDGFKFMTVR